MINHIRTLLFNRNSEQAAEAAPWRVDPSFVPLDQSGPESDVLSALFANARSDADRAMTVDFCMPFLEAPEFAGFFSSFDTRSTVVPRVGSPGSVSEFQSRSGTDDGGVVGRVVSSDSAQSVFRHTGDSVTDGSLDRLKAIFSDGMRTWRQFSAVLYAVVFRLDLQMSRSAP